MDLDAFSCLNLPLLTPHARSRFFGHHESFDKAWGACGEPRWMLWLVVHALEASQQRNGEIQLGDLLTTLLDLTETLHEPIDAGLPEEGREPFRRFLEACRTGVDARVERAIETDLVAQEVIPDRGEYELASGSKILPPIVLKLIEALNGIATNTNRGRFEPAVVTSTWATVRRWIEAAISCLDLLAHVPLPTEDTDERLDRMVRVIWIKFRAKTIRCQLNGEAPAITPDGYLSLFFHAKPLPGGRPAPEYATLHHPQTGALLARISPDWSITLQEPVTQVLLDAIRPNAFTRVVRVRTDRPTCLHTHRYMPGQAPDAEDPPALARMDALPFWTRT